MKKIKFLFLISLTILLVSCTTTKQITNTQANADDGKIDFTFLQLNDVYEIAPLEGGKVAGMARVANLRNTLLKENPNTYTFMAGDFLNPSLLGSLKVNGKRIKGEQMVDVMNALGMDLVTLGNHEFDLSKHELQQRLNESDFAWTSANARQRVCGTTYPFYKEKDSIKEFVTDTYIMDVSDEDGTAIKIGFFGVVLPSNPQSYVKYFDIYEQSKRAYNLLKDKVDLVFGLTHVEIAQDVKIAKLLPEVPLIMGGHEHNNMFVEEGNTVITKADANAKTVYVHRINYDKKTKKYSINSELVPINKETGEDEKVKRIVDKWGAILDKEITKIVQNPYEVIYIAKTPLDGRDVTIRSVQTNLGTLIARAMAYAFNDEVDAALVNGGSIRIDDELSGDINSVDIFRVLPFGGGILKVKLTGALLQQVLDYGRSHAGEGSYLQRYNATFVDGIWLIDNKPIVPEKIYTVAFSDYLLRGLDIPFLNSDNKGVITVDKPQKDELGFDIRKAVIAYLKSLK